MSVELDCLPAGSQLCSVDAAPAFIAGRSALRVKLEDSIATHGKPNVDYVDMPTFVKLPIVFTNGALSVDVLSRLHDGAPDYARAFAGLAYRIAGDLGSFESVYLRPLNGISLNPPPPRDKRAVQYFAYPDWRFERLRETYPDGRYEAAADIVPDRWINLNVDVDEDKLMITVNGKLTNNIAQNKAAPCTGQIGLFVDIGTEAYFSNLVVKST